MADLIPPILIKLAADVNDLKAGLAQAQTSLKGLDDNVKKTAGSLGGFTSKLKSVGAALGATFAATQLSAFAKDTVMAASSMAESVSKVNVVFGQGASEVLKFGEGAATNLGISNQAALEAAGTYGNLFQAFGIGQGESQKMSTSLVQLASDMASFNNTSVDDAIIALRSGLSGETEPLKRFGVALSEVRLKEEALRMGLITTMSGTLPVAIKSQAAYSLILKDTALSQGDYARTADGTANTMKTLAARFQDAKVALGNALMPAFRGLLKILNLLIPVLQAIGDYFVENREALKAYGLIIVTVGTAFGIYKIATGAATAATKLFTAALMANPLFRFVTILLLVGAGFVKLYNNFAPFKKIVDAGLKIIITGFGYFLGLLAKIVTVLSKLPGGGIFKGMAAGLDQAAISAGKYANAFGKSKDQYYALYGEGDSKQGSKTATGETVGTDATGQIIAAQKTKLERMKNYLEEIQKINKDYDDKKLDIQERYDESVDKILDSFNEQKEEMEKEHKQRLLDIEKEYADKTNEIILNASNKRKDIIQESINIMTSGFASATKVDLGQLFIYGGGATGLVGQLQGSLDEAKKLQAAAGKLAAKGYNQQFINEIIAKGPLQGSMMADSILSASPETQKAIQALYNQVQKTSETGLDALAAKMNDGTSFANSGLAQAYAQVGVDLQIQLAKNAEELNNAVIKQNLIFESAQTKARIALEKALSEAKAIRDKDLIKAQKIFTDAIVLAEKSFLESAKKISTQTQAQLQALIEKALLAKKTLDDLSKPPANGGSTGQKSSSLSDFKYDPLSSITNITYNTPITVQGTNAKPIDLQNAAMLGVKYGTPITVSGVY